MSNWMFFLDDLLRPAIQVCDFGSGPVPREGTQKGLS